ncbi:MAG: hypothetical protein LBQ75_05350 [Zoogloeaceae bacterium]|jgi:hypothetical protein|nr:hypothetical protein [Zoogloeaceae bacterium]
MLLSAMCAKKIPLYGVLFCVLTACAATGVLNRQPSALKQAVAAVDGSFGLRFGRPSFSNYSKREKLIGIVLAQLPGTGRDDPPDNLLAELIDCFDDPSPSASVFQDQPVPLGWVCYSALTGLVYHEETDEEGDITEWDGYPEFPATLQDMKAAKTAWQKVLREKTYLSY